MAADDFERPAYVDPGAIDGHPGLNWYTRVEKVHGRDLKPGQWLDSLDHSGARTIHHITELTTDSRLVSFSDIDGDSEVVRTDVLYDVVDPASQVAPDGTPARMVLQGEGERSAAQRLLSLATDSLAEDCYTNNPPELAVLEGVFFEYPLAPNATTALAHAFTDATKAGLVVNDLTIPTAWKLTEAGEQRLADLWGPDRVPPGKGGHVSCWDHGVYVAAPGDLWACPECQDADYAAVMRGIEADGDLILTDVLADAEAQRLAVEPNIRAFEASRRRRKLFRQLAFLAAVAVAVVAVLAFVTIGRL